MNKLEVRRIRSKGPCCRETYEVLDRIVELQREAFGFSDALLVPSYGIDMTNWTFALYKDGEVIGYAMCCLSDDEVGQGLELTLQQLGVAKKERRHGYGTHLMEAIAAEARKPRLPIHSIKWCQDPMLARVAGFYISEHVPGVGRRVIKNRYGVLNGNYAGLPSHRLEVCLDLSASRKLPSFTDLKMEEVFEPDSIRNGGKPETRWTVLNSGSVSAFRVPIPWDFEKMKEDAALAASWQTEVVAVLNSLCGQGYRAVNFRRAEDPQWGEYMMLRS